MASIRACRSQCRSEDTLQGDVKFGAMRRVDGVTRGYRGMELG